MGRVELLDKVEAARTAPTTDACRAGLLKVRKEAEAAVETITKAVTEMAAEMRGSEIGKAVEEAAA